MGDALVLQVLMTPVLLWKGSFLELSCLPMVPGLTLAFARNWASLTPKWSTIRGSLPAVRLFRARFEWPLRRVLTGLRATWTLSGGPWGMLFWQSGKLREGVPVALEPSWPVWPFLITTWVYYGWVFSVMLPFPTLCPIGKGMPKLFVNYRHHHYYSSGSEFRTNDVETPVA